MDREAPPHPAVRFDHAVVVARDQLDDTAEQWRRMGFLLTERGYHTLGSINHLVVLGATYVELLGFPPGRADVRPDLRDARRGLDALVFGTDDAQSMHDAARARGAAVQPVQSFSRPVSIDGRLADARFRTVRLPPDASAAGRLYACEHLTPELVWHEPWRAHPNGALELRRIEVRVHSAAREAALYRSLLGDAALAQVAGGFDVHAAPVRIEVREDASAPPAMTTLVIGVRELARLRACLTAAAVACETRDGAIDVPPERAGGVRVRFEA